MASQKVTILTCDVCGKKVEAEESGWIGGHPFSGWFTLKEHSGSTQLAELQRKKEWNICSLKCLKEFSTKPRK